MDSFWDLGKDLKTDYKRGILRDKRNDIFDIIDRGYNSHSIFNEIIIRDKDLPTILFVCCERMNRKSCEISEDERKLALYILKELKKLFPYDNFESIF